MGKNVAVFVDVANIFYAAKAAGVDIDYVTLLKSATAGRDLVRAYAYTGLDPDNENQRNFHDFLRRSNYKVVSKDIRKYGDGKVKANLDIELVVDMMKTARNLDIAIVVSGDGDFAPAIRAVQEQGVRVEVISFRGNTSSDLMDVADQFTDIVALARVEKGSRSGRRVAEDAGDLSMTEVPDKLTEGSGDGRGSRGRGRGRVREEEPAAPARSRGRGRAAAPVIGTAVTTGSGSGFVALPGERLARAGGGPSEADLASAEVFTLDDLDETAGDMAVDDSAGAGRTADGAAEEFEPRRRRRRGGRGRGRGRAQSDDGADVDGAPEPSQVSESAGPVREPSQRPTPQRAAPQRDTEEEADDVAPVRRAPRATPFGSVWDSQLGSTPAPARASGAPVSDDEDFDEPEIPEYLIAEQRRGANRGARGGRSAYQSAMERERYGRGGGGGVRGGSGGGVGSGGGRGINRYPDVSGRPRPGGPERADRSYSRPEREIVQQPRSSSEPWSDVPPELEALLRAQVAQKPTRTATNRGSGDQESRSAAQEPVSTAPETPAAEPRARTTRKPSSRAAVVASTSGQPAAASSAGGSWDDRTDVTLEPVAKRRTTRPPKVEAVTGDATAVEAVAEPSAPAPRATRTPRATPQTALAASAKATPTAVTRTAASAAAKRVSATAAKPAPTTPAARAVRKPAAKATSTSASSGPAEPGGVPDPVATPKPRAARKTAVPQSS